MKTILLDCDGVICDFLGGLLAAVNADRGTSYDPSDCRQWDIGKAYGLDWKYLDSIITRSGFCAELLPCPHAISAVLELRKHHEVFVVTSPFDNSPHWMPERSAWLREHFGIDKSHVIHANTKHVIWGDLLIDDRPENVIGWANRWRGSRAILWDATYNQNAELPSNAIREERWGRVLAAAEEA